MVDSDELTGPWIWQRLQQDAFDHAEDRRVGAYTQRECQDRNAREDWHPHETPQELVQTHKG
jgi:hypothetical protein